MTVTLYVCVTFSHYFLTISYKVLDVEVLRGLHTCAFHKEGVICLV